MRASIKEEEPIVPATIAFANTISQRKLLVGYRFYVADDAAGYRRDHLGIVCIHHKHSITVVANNGKASCGLGKRQIGCGVYGACECQEAKETKSNYAIQVM